MIYIRSKGRLGNQLFIYAFARALSKKLNQGILMYDRKNEKDNRWYSHLDNYKLHSSVKFTSQKKMVLPKSFMGKLLYYRDRLFLRGKDNEKIHTGQLERMKNNIKYGLLLLQDGYIDLSKYNIPQNVYCDGYFQSPAYFDEIRDDLLQELTPINEYTDEEKAFVNEIKKYNSVCVTIRLGDYLGNSVHQVCTKEYYLSAMRKMKEMQPDCHFFVFSDEVEKAKDVFQFEYPVTYESTSPKSSDIIGLDIMSKCNHFIISNSSYSWWAQYLGNYKNKIVISPDHWYASDVPCDIMQSTWLKMEC